MSGKRLGAAWIIALAAIGLDARAQSMDYGALERLFGEPVTTSATGSPQRVSDVPVTMAIVTAEQIRRSGAYDIPGVLRHVLGVDFQQWMNDQAEISVRGYDQAFSQRVLVLIDGRQVYADYFSFTPWSTLPVELGAIRQIEIVKSPGSALFGFNAVGGVINIITYSPLHDDVDTVSVSGGTQALAQGSAVTTLRLRNAGLRISAGARSDEDFSTPIPATMTGVGRPNESRRSIDLDGALQLADRTQLRVELSRTQVGQNQITPAYLQDISKYTTDSARAELSLDVPVGLVQATAYTNRIDQHSFPGIFGSDLRFTNRVSVFQLQDVLKPGTGHALRAALEYRDDSEGTTPVAGARVFYHVISASGMWEWRITPPVSLTNAVRFDALTLGREGFIPADYPFSNADWDRSVHEVSFNSGVVWKPGDRDTLRLTVARGVLLPSLFNLGAVLAVTPVFGVSGAPTIQPTIVTSYEASWGRSLPSLTGHLHANVFQQSTTGVQSLLGGFIQTTAVPYALPSNVGSSRATGVELAIDGKSGERWRWGVSARFEDIADEFNAVAADGAAYVDYEHMTADGVINASVGWTHGRWEEDVFLRYQSRTAGLIPVAQGTALAPVPAYVSADARIGYQVSDRITAAVSGQNLTHSRQRQTSGAEVERRVFATVTMQF